MAFSFVSCAGGEAEANAVVCGRFLPASASSQKFSSLINAEARHKFPHGCKSSWGKIWAEFPERPAAQQRLSITSAGELATTPDLDVLALHEALEELTTMDPQQARIVELKFFGGLSIEETAEVLSLGHATVERDWKMARAWLRLKLT